MAGDLQGRWTTTQGSHGTEGGHGGGGLSQAFQRDVGTETLGYIFKKSHLFSHIRQKTLMISYHRLYMHLNWRLLPFWPDQEGHTHFHLAHFHYTDLFDYFNVRPKLANGASPLLQMRHNLTATVGILVGIHS